MKRLSEFKLHLLVAVVALASWRLIQLNQEPEVVAKTAENSPDFFSLGYNKRETDAEGLVKNELFADKMQHFKADGSTKLDKPVMSLFNANGVPPWIIKSDSGVMAADGDNLQLNGQAIISRAASENTRALTINTSDLRVKLNSNYAETDKWAEIISPPHKTTGEGMQVTFVSPIHLKLLSKVKGYYEFK